MAGVGGGSGPRPDLDTAWIFAVVARHGNIRAASVELGMSQSTVSRRVASLEQILGAKLLVRSTEGVSLTDVGRTVSHITADLEGTLARIDRIGRSLKRDTTVTISSSDGIGGYWLPICLAGFNVENPGITLSIVCGQIGGSSDMTRAEADIDVTYKPPDEPDTYALGKGTLPLQLFASRTYAKEKGLPRTLGELREHSIVAHEVDFIHGLGGGDWDSYVDIVRDHPNVAYRVNSSLALGFAIRSGWGIGVQPSMVSLTEHSMIPIDNDVYQSSMEFWLVMHRDTKDNPAPRVVANWIKQRFMHGTSGLGEFVIADGWE